MNPDFIKSQLRWLGDSYRLYLRDTAVLQVKHIAALAVLLTWKSVRSGALGSGGSPPKMYEIGTLEGVLEIVLSGFSTISNFFGVESEVASNVLTTGLFRIQQSSHESASTLCRVGSKEAAWRP
jgi:hypothetical protein